MTVYWPWVACGAALAGVVLVHWLFLGRTLAVSGRISAIVDRLRLGPPEEEEEMTQEELIAAMRAATAEAFGEDAVGEEPDLTEEDGLPPAPPPQPWWIHVTFLVSLTIGGLLASLTAGTQEVTTGLLRGDLFAKTFGATSSMVPLILIGGGMLVGFGTRMSGGCTSGHGLCGVSRFQPGSLVATMAFFGMGVATSFLLEMLW